MRPRFRRANHLPHDTGHTETYLFSSGCVSRGSGSSQTAHVSCFEPPAELAEQIVHEQREQVSNPPMRQILTAKPAAAPPLLNQRVL
jgi:hypothetical protein